MTKAKMLNEIDRMKQRIYRELDFDTRKAIMYRQNELMNMTGINKTKGGEQRFYLTKSASKPQVDDYLTTLINAQYDVMGRCL